MEQDAISTWTVAWAYFCSGVDRVKLNSFILLHSDTGKTLFPVCVLGGWVTLQMYVTAGMHMLHSAPTSQWWLYIRKLFRLSPVCFARSIFYTLCIPLTYCLQQVMGRQTLSTFWSHGVILHEWSIALHIMESLTIFYTSVSHFSF